MLVQKSTFAWHEIFTMQTENFYIQEHSKLELFFTITFASHQTYFDSSQDSLSYIDAVTYTVLVLLVHALPVEVGAAASTEEVRDTWVTAAAGAVEETA